MTQACSNHGRILGENAFELPPKNLAEGRAYKFLVRAVSTEGDSPDLETEEAVVAKNPFDPPTPPQKGSLVSLKIDLLISN